MGQLDVHERADGAGPLLIILQADAVQVLNVVVAAPLYPDSEWKNAARHLHPRFDIDGRGYVLVTNHLAAVPVETIGRKIASLADHRFDIINALDFLFTGI